MKVIRGTVVRRNEIHFESRSGCGTNQRGQITMSDAEITEFVERSRVSTMATIGVNGTPHLVAMWYAVIDGELWFETKAKSQKAVNLRRDDRLTMMIEDGDTYDTLRGVSIEVRRRDRGRPGGPVQGRDQHLGATRGRTPRTSSRRSR